MLNAIYWYFLVVFDEALFLEIFLNANYWSLTICSLGGYFVYILIDNGTIEYVLYVEVGEGASTIDIEGVGYLIFFLHLKAISNYRTSFYLIE
jgi:hypothetical protein